MSIEGLIELRDSLTAQLAKRRTLLEAQIAHLEVGAVARRRGRPPGLRSALKGRKVPPKYRGPKGETWAGRGVAPRWLVALMKQGHTKQEFAIDQRATAGAKKKRVVRRSRRKK
jgi:DNA-binding protein H-NS